MGLHRLLIGGVASSVLFSTLAFANNQETETVTIPAGPFNMGCSIGDTSCEKDEGTEGGIKVSVKAFIIDRHEVTVADYQKCIDAGECQRPKDNDRNKYCNLGADGRDQHPINCVDWIHAQTYCSWQDGRLPFEAEWEKAARGDTTTRYPWGNEVSCDHAILDDGVTMGSVANEPDGCGEDRTWPIASRSANSYGLYDMHGNAGEWTANGYASDALKHYAKGDLSYPSNSPRTVVRGGSWDENTLNLRSSFRNVKLPESGNSVYGSIGFRCAYDSN